MDVQHEIMRHAHAHEHTNKHIVSTLVELRWKIWNVSQFWFDLARSFRFFSKYVSFHCCTSIFIFNKIECDYILAPHEKKRATRNWFSEQIDMKSLRPNENWSVCTRASLFLLVSFKFLRQFSFLFTLQELLVLLSFCQLLFRSFIFSSYSFEFFICLVHDRSRCDHNAITCCCFKKSLSRWVNFKCTSHNTPNIFHRIRAYVVQRHWARSSSPSANATGFLSYFFKMQNTKQKTKFPSK